MAVRVQRRADAPTAVTAGPCSTELLEMTAAVPRWPGGDDRCCPADSVGFSTVKAFSQGLGALPWHNLPGWPDLCLALHGDNS